MLETTSKTPMRETDLYEPIRTFLERQGYTVRAEVHACDVAAEKDGDVVVVELKLRVNLELLLQATDRLRITDAVYVAVPGRPELLLQKRWRGVKRVLRMLELGLIFVDLDEAPPLTQVAFHPTPYARQRQKRRKRALLREMDGRAADLNVGGAVRRKLLTAYRQNAVRIACCLSRLGPSSPKQLRALGASDNTLSILYRNVYGWFERLDRATYDVTARGREEIAAYPQLLERFNAELDAHSAAEDA